MKKIKINNSGNLYINGIQKFCPFNSDTCGLHCPLFREPELTGSTKDGKKEYFIRICKRQLKTTNLIYGEK